MTAKMDGDILVLTSECVSDTEIIRKFIPQGYEENGLRDFYFKAEKCGAIKNDSGQFVQLFFKK